MDNLIICQGTMDNCYNLAASYGMICVRCGCCHEDEKIRVPARLKMHQSELEDAVTFDGWLDDEDLRRLQEANIAEKIRYHNKKIAEYQKQLEELERKET